VCIIPHAKLSYFLPASLSSVIWISVFGFAATATLLALFQFIFSSTLLLLVNMRLGPLYTHPIRVTVEIERTTNDMIKSKWHVYHKLDII